MLTGEQQLAVNTILRPEVRLLKIEACAGSGKTHTLIEMARQLDVEKGLYLAYNKAIAVEATEKFAGTNIECSTIHSMAYRSIVKQWGLKIGWFNPRDVQSGLHYQAKKEVVKSLEGFLSSKYVTQDEYFDYNPCEEHIEELVRHHLDLMADGQIDSPHSFYLKMYHVLLATGGIPAPVTNLLMLDEFGDITGITLDIFRLIIADKKIAVGDSMQNIYSFNNTVNGFEALKDEGETVMFTKSFRVSDVIASRIQGFVRAELVPDFQFVGREYPEDHVSSTKGYVSRTNGGLLEEMLRLKGDNVAFHTTRKIEAILELPIILANLGNGKRIENNKFKAIEKLRSRWDKESKAKNDEFLKINSTPLKYVLKEFSDDPEISRGADTVIKYGPFEINALTKYVNNCKSIETGLTLTTAHSSKGLEFDVIEIAPDFNDRITEVMEDIEIAISEENYDLAEVLREEYRLYYVACSRAMVRLDNAKHLPRAMIKG